MRFLRSGAAGRPRHLLVLNWRDLGHPEGGGSELYVRQVADRLHQCHGTRITWFTAHYPGASREELADGIRYIRRGGHVSVYLWAAALLMLGRFGRVDAVLEVQNGMPFLSRLFTRARVVVLVHHVHREQWYVVGPLLSRVGWWLESRVAVRVGRGLRYVAVSDRTRQELIELGVAAGDIDIAHNGVPPAPAHLEATGRAADPTLVVLSRLVPHKQIDHAIRMMPALVKRHPRVTLRVMGSGWWHDQLVALRDELSLGKRVQFLGHVDEETKYDELSRAWLHLMPSLKEGWGLSIIEAARMGVPSVAYASAGGVTESILDGVTGVLVEDERDLLRQVDALLHEPERLAGLGEKARLRSTLYTWEAAAERVRSALFEERRQILR